MFLEDHVGIVWIYRKIRPKSRLKWKRYEERTGNWQKLSLSEWREQFQISKSQDPAKLVKKKSSPFPRVTSISENGRKVRIVIKGKETKKDLLEKNIVEVDQQLHEANFTKFKVLKSSYNDRSRKHEGWIFRFEVLDEHDRVIDSHETSPIQVLADSKQLPDENVEITELVPPEGEILKEHKVTIFGSFKYHPAMKVFFEETAVAFQHKTQEIILASGVSRNAPQTVPVWVQSKNEKSNHVPFTFFNPADRARNIKFPAPSDDHPSTNEAISYNQFTFTSNTAKGVKRARIPVNETCSYPIFFFQEAAKYPLQELKSSRDHAGKFQISNFPFLNKLFRIRIHFLALELWSRRFTINSFLFGEWI